MTDNKTPELQQEPLTSHVSAILDTPKQQKGPLTAQGDEQVIRIPFHRLQKSPTNPRKTRDAEADRELAHSIKDNYARGGPGILEPLLCRPIEPGNPTGQLEVVAGSRRLAAAKAADLDDAPCIIREMTDSEALEVQIVENLQRRDVEPIEEARGLKFLSEQMTVKEIAKRIGKSAAYVYQALKLCELIPAAQKAMESQGLSAGHAIQIARLSPIEQKKALEIVYPQWNRDKKTPSVGVRELAKQIQETATIPLKEATFNTKDEKLLPGATACGPCPSRAENNPLFADLPPNNCTDRDCFSRKTQASIQQKIEKAAKAKRPLVQISPYSAPKPPKKDDPTLYAEHYHHAGKQSHYDYGTCKSMIEGIQVAGADIGQIKTVCPDRKCPKHWQQAASPNRGPDKKKQQLAEKINTRAIGYCINDLLDGQTKLNRDDLFTLYCITTERMNQRYEPHLLAEMKGPEIDKVRPFIFTKAHKATASEKDLAKTIVAQLMIMSASATATPKKYLTRAKGEVMAETSKKKTATATKPAAKKAPQPKAKPQPKKQPAAKAAKKAR